MPFIIVPVTAAFIALQVWASYTLIRNIFRWLALTLLAYVGAAILAKRVAGLSLHVAVKPGNRGGDRDGPPAARRSPGRDASTLFKTGATEINTAAEAAEALRPLAGGAASALFALGVICVGFLAVRIMTTGDELSRLQSDEGAGVFGDRAGFSTPPLLLLIMLMTNNRTIMGNRTK